MFEMRFPIRPKRKIVGMSAILLPFLDNGDIDWDGFQSHLNRTLKAGLVPAVNMDTGFANLIDENTKRRILKLTSEACNGRTFLAGALVQDQPGAPFCLDAVRRQLEPILEVSGTPIVFPSFGIHGLAEEQVADCLAQIARHTSSFYAFELGTMFVPFGRIFSLETFEQVLAIPECVGIKHSSLDRLLEWQRLEIRDRVRPSFQILTGNDLAIDMVMYGSDYLLGLSTFAPDAFALRDRYWYENDTRFFPLNDLLQYLGFLAFRSPTPGYRHSAAQFLKILGYIGSDQTHPMSPRRPDSDLPLLRQIAEHLGKLVP